MRKSERDKRNYIIIGLCAIVAVMAIGFAAFNQQLKINSTSEVTSTWCVGFDSTKTSDYVATAGLNGGTLPTASMSYSGNTCGSDNLQTGANLSATFKQPGDQVVYTFTIKNDSTLKAKLDSIDENITTSNSAIDYELSGASEGDILGAGETTTLVVTVRYKSSITGQPDTTAWGLSIKLNFSQTNESAGGSGGGSSDALPNGTYYALNNNSVYVNKGICAWDSDAGYCNSWYDTEAECLEDYEDVDYIVCGNVPLEQLIGNETNYSNLEKNIFNKYVVSGGIITEAYSCTKFSFITDPVCMRGYSENGENPSSFYIAATTGNKAIIESLADTFSSENEECFASDSYGRCLAGDLYVNASSGGGVGASDGSVGETCNVEYDGNAYCT